MKAILAVILTTAILLLAQWSPAFRKTLALIRGPSCRGLINARDHATIRRRFAICLNMLPVTKDGVSPMVRALRQRASSSPRAPQQFHLRRLQDGHLQLQTRRTAARQFTPMVNPGRGNMETGRWKPARMCWSFHQGEALIGNTRIARQIDRSCDVSGLP